MLIGPNETMFQNTRLHRKTWTPTARNIKPRWYTQHNKFVKYSQLGGTEILLIGDSIINGLLRYNRVWSKYFGPLSKTKALNFGISGDCTQDVLWRIQNGEVPKDLSTCVIHCGTNNIGKDSLCNIARGIITIAEAVQKAKPNAKIIIIGLLPRDQKQGFMRKSTYTVNDELKHLCQRSTQKNLFLLEPDDTWTMPNEDLDKKLYFQDNLHLIEGGNEKLAGSVHLSISNLKEKDKQSYKTSHMQTQLQKHTQPLKPLLMQIQPQNQAQIQPQELNTQIQPQNYSQPQPQNTPQTRPHKYTHTLSSKHHHSHAQSQEHTTTKTSSNASTRTTSYTSTKTPSFTSPTTKIYKTTTTTPPHTHPPKHHHTQAKPQKYTKAQPQKPPVKHHNSQAQPLKFTKPQPQKPPLKHHHSQAQP